MLYNYKIYLGYKYFVLNTYVNLYARILPLFNIFVYLFKEWCLQNIFRIRLQIIFVNFLLTMK